MSTHPTQIKCEMFRENTIFLVTASLISPSVHLCLTLIGSLAANLGIELTQMECVITYYLANLIAVWKHVERSASQFFLQICLESLFPTVIYCSQIKGSIKRSFQILPLSTVAKLLSRRYLPWRIPLNTFLHVLNIFCWIPCVLILCFKSYLLKLVLFILCFVSGE